MLKMDYKKIWKKNFQKSDFMNFIHICFLISYFEIVYINMVCLAK